jgi:hypothetical protein
MFRVPSSVVTRRPISLQGQVVPAGTALSKDQVLALGKGLNALLDSGYVVANPDPFARKGKARPTPTSLPPVIRNAMVSRLTAPEPLSVFATVVGDSISVEVNGGVPSFDVSLDGGDHQTKSSRTFAFTGVSEGTHEIVVTDGNGEVTASLVAVNSDHKKPSKKKKAEEDA